MAVRRAAHGPAPGTVASGRKQKRRATFAYQPYPILTRRESTKAHGSPTVEQIEPGTF
ncbi:hypothetical protein BCAR13_310008 [Paraburkholderia caribensis]|nr:hypothetical protein BCAR13_310008 [Paraburkholderia caribensis]